MTNECFAPQLANCKRITPFLVEIKHLLFQRMERMNPGGVSTRSDALSIVVQTSSRAKVMLEMTERES